MVCRVHSVVGQCIASMHIYLTMTMQYQSCLVVLMDLNVYHIVDVIVVLVHHLAIVIVH